MTDSARTDSPAPADAIAGLSIATLRDVLFVVILLLAWATVTPFADLADPKLLESDTGDFLNQISYVVVGGCAFVFLASHPQTLRMLRRPVYVAMLAWLAVSVVTSSHPDLSAKRFVFTALVMLTAAALPLLPSGIRRFTDLTAGVVVGILFLCYAGVLLAPSLSIHQADDVVEPLLAGDWRGIFAHKNIAGPMMVIFIFIGLFVATVRSRILGWSIVTAAAIFLLFCAAKTATLMLPVVLIISLMVVRMRSAVAQATIIIVLMATLELMTIGTLFSETLSSFIVWLMPDATFTGRTDIWQFAIDNIGENPILGHGFQAFWRTNEVIDAIPLYRDGPNIAEHAHNGFLDLALATGIPGLVLGILWTLVLPFVDLQRCKRAAADPALTLLFTRIWLFAIASSSFESVLFNRAELLWFTMLVALFGLRYLSISRPDP